MRACARHGFVMAGVVALLLPFVASSQESRYPELIPQALVEGYGGCFGPRCFSYAAALDGETALTVNTGPSVSVTQRNNAGEWPLHQVLTNPDFTVPDNYPAIERALPFPPFGGPLALHGDTLLASGTSKKYNYRPIVYVMQRDSAGEWSKFQVLALPRFADLPEVRIESIALHGNTALVSSLHSRTEGEFTVATWARVDVFMRQTSGLFSRRAFMAPAGRALKFEGYRVAVDGRTALLGDPSADGNEGRGYIYELTAKGWTLRRTLLNATGTAGRLGSTVVIDGNRLAIASPEEAVAPNAFGAVYVYEKSGTTWEQSQIITSPEFFPYEGWPSEFPPEERDGWRFGEHIALDGDRLVVTLYNQNWWTWPPLAYLFERRTYSSSPTRWLAVATLGSPLGLPYAGGAYLSGARLLLGAADDAYSQAGYVFELPVVGFIDP